MSHSPATRRAAHAAACVIMVGALAACGNSEDTAESTPTVEATVEATAETSAGTPVETTAETTAEATTEAETETETESESETESASETPAESSETAAQESEETSAPKLEESVDEAYETFAALAPRSLFEEFSTCDPAGLKNSYNCSGPEVGQFQFFKSDTKASQTTQVLTELRSSHVVEDSGSRVVGWSTLGTTAVLTVVDNKEGLVMQQMISTDQDDPEERLAELGLL